MAFGGMYHLVLYIVPAESSPIPCLGVTDAGAFVRVWSGHSCRNHC